MESIKKKFTDIAEALIFWVGAVIGLRRFKPQIDVTIDFVTAGAEASARAIKRLFNHNLVVALRPLYSRLIWAQAVFCLIGLMPMLLLSYWWEVGIYGAISLVLIAVMVSRRRRLDGVMPFNSLDALMAPDRLVRGFGPGDRFSTLDFIGFPIIIALQSVLIIIEALVLRASYGTSMAFIWTMMFVAGIGLVFAYNVNRFFLYLAMLVVEGPAEWAERVIGQLARAVLSPALIGIDDSNVDKLLLDSPVNELKSFVARTKGMLAKTYHLSIPLLVLAAVSGHLELTAVTIFATFFFGLYQNSRIERGGKGADEARASIERAEKFLYGVSVIAFIVHFVELLIFRKHALPATEATVVFMAGLTRLISQNLILLMICSTALGLLARWLITNTFDKPLLITSKVAGLIVAGFVIVLTVMGWFDTAGVLVRTEDSYFHRFDHPSDEDLSCLNGKRDYDEVSTDHGENCGPYRRPHNTAEYRSSASSPFTTEPVAGGNLFQRIGCWVFDRGCVGQAERAPQRGLGNGPQGSSSNRTALLAYNEPTTKAYHPPQGGGSAPTGALSPYEPLIASAVSQYPSIPHDYLRAVMYTESRFHTDVTSHAGAHGLMQFMPRTASHYGITNTGDPEQVVPAGAHYLSDLYARAEGSQEDRLCLAAAGYNSGSGGMLSIMRGYSERQTLLQSCRTGDLSAYPRGDDRFQKHRYAVTVMSRYRDYLNGIAPSAPSHGYRSYAVASRSSNEERDDVDNDVEPRQELAEADLSANADACATMSEPILEIMRLRGRCP